MSSPTDTGTRFAFVTSDDHGGWIWLATLLSLTYSFLILGVRGIVKWRRYSLDDTVLVVAYICGLGHWSSVLSALKHGLGKSGERISDAQESKASELIFASRVLLFITLALSKCCVLLLIRLLFTEHRRNIWLTCNICIGLVLAWGIGSALAVSVGCTADDTIPGYTEAHCASDALRWKIVTAFDVISEVVFVIFASIFVSPLQMRFQRKFLVVFAFSFRLPVAALGIVSLHSYLNHLHYGRTSIGLAASISWQEAWLSYSLMSATIPCLKGFVKSFTTAGMAGAINPTGSGHDTHGGSFAMDSIRSARNIRLRPEPVGHTAEIYSGHPMDHTHSHGQRRDEELGEENGSTASKGSKEMIIKKVVEWGYTSS